VSLGPVEEKYWFTDEARIIRDEIKLPIYATLGTAAMLEDVGIPCTAVGKQEGNGITGMDVIDRGDVDLVITVTREYDSTGRPDVYEIRRRAVDAAVPLFTDLQLARAVVEALRWRSQGQLSLAPWNQCLQHALS
jgi:carbamoyl-phosphate synthase large subunit